MFKSFKSSEEAYYGVLNLLSKQKDEDYNDYVNIPTKKIYNLNFDIKKPRLNLIKNSTRNINYKMLLGELFYHLQGKDDIDSIRAYNSSYEKLSDDTTTINGMLGARIFYYDSLFDFYEKEKVNEDGDTIKEYICDHIVINQFEKCVEKINTTKSFNICIYNPTFDINTIHPANISNLLFYVDDNKLNMSVNILNLDFYTRFPYLSFILSNLLAVMSAQLKIKVGKINFNCNILTTLTNKCKIDEELIYTSDEKVEDFDFYDIDEFTTIFDIELLTRVQGSLINVEDLKSKLDSITNKYWKSLIAVLAKLNVESNDFDDYILEEHRKMLE
jgi:thymidylate synthase